MLYNFYFESVYRYLIMLWQYVKRFYIMPIKHTVLLELCRCICLLEICMTIFDKYTQTIKNILF